MKAFTCQIKGRRDALKAIEAEPRTLDFYESTHRLLDSLEDIVCGIRRIPLRGSGA